MARAYKTYIGLHFLGGKQLPILVCTQTKKKAVELLNKGGYYTMGDLNTYMSVLTNEDNKYHQIGLANKDKLMYVARNKGEKEYEEYKNG